MIAKLYIKDYLITLYDFYISITIEFHCILFNGVPVELLGD